MMAPELWWALGLFVAIILTAAAVNKFVPAARPRIRPLVIMYLLYVLALGIARALGRVDETAWADRFEIATQVLRVLALVGLFGTILFRLLLRGVLPLIATDLLVGVGSIVATIGVLSQHGLDPVGALATGAVVSAVLAISLQSTLGNILGGVALQLDGSIHEGDWIQLENGKQGRIRAIRWRHTLVETRDWSTIVVPNVQLLQSSFTLLGQRDDDAAPQRIWVWFNVDFRFAPQRVIDIVTDGLCGSPIENVAPDPKPNVVCMDFAKDGRDSFASYAARYWIIDLAHDDPTSSRVRARIFTALKRAGIPLAMPAMTNFIERHDREHDDAHDARLRATHLAGLRAIHLFKSLTEQELETLAQGMSTVVYTKGETITRQGAVAHYLYVLVHGSVEVRTRNLDDPNSEQRVVATLDAPEFYGEMGLMTGVPRGADVVARTDVECYRLGKSALERVLAARPEIANELAEILATRHVGLEDARVKLDEDARRSHHDMERDKILRGIKGFFGL